MVYFTHTDSHVLLTANCVGKSECDLELYSDSDGNIAETRMVVERERIKPKHQDFTEEFTANFGETVGVTDNRACHLRSYPESTAIAFFISANIRALLHRIGTMIIYINIMLTGIKAMTINIRTMLTDIKAMTINIRTMLTDIKPMTINIRTMLTDIKPMTIKIRTMLTGNKPVFIVINIRSINYQSIIFNY